jgi:hypothetical protein
VIQTPVPPKIKLSGLMRAPGECRISALPFIIIVALLEESFKLNFQTIMQA